MPTQISSTPLVTGEAAIAIWKEMQQKPTEASKRGTQLLAEKFKFSKTG